MKNYQESYSSLLLDSGVYDASNMGTNAVINTLRCIEDGQIVIKALGGGSFTWNATRNKKINVLTNNVKINTGFFVAMFDRNQTPDSEATAESIPFMWIDENGDYFVDENGDFLTLN